MKRLVEILHAGVTDSSGAVVASGTVTSYEGGTTTLQTLYQDWDLETPHSNPLTLDAAGRATAYVDGRVKLVISSSAGSVVRTVDQVGSEDSDVSAAVANLVAGAGLSSSVGGTLSVNVDGSTITINSDDELIASRNLTVKSITSTDSPYSVVAGDDLIEADTSSGAIIINPPAANTSEGRELIIRRSSGGTNGLTLNTTIDSITNTTLDTQKEVIRIIAGDTQWVTLERKCASEREAYTPVGAWTTNATYTAMYRRVGDSIDGSIKVAFAGPVAGSPFTANIPVGLTINTSKLVSNNVPIGIGLLEDTGSANYPLMIFLNNTTTVRAEHYVANTVVLSPLTNTGPVTIGNTDVLNVSFTVPITGWKA